MKVQANARAVTSLGPAVKNALHKAAVNANKVALFKTTPAPATPNNAKQLVYKTKRYSEK